ncbi:MAG TPA: hypothetical protein VNA13_00830 [Xanthomonadales bacterium]|nr:hypothetical protein [Xanthomonadales bacterium]
MRRGIFLCDTARELIEGTREDDSVVIKLEGETLVHSRDVQEAVREHQDVRNTLNNRLDKKIVVPTNMVVRNRRASSGGLLLLSSLGSYDRRFAAGILGCQSDFIDGEGIDLEAVTGRKIGESSVVVEKDVLRKFDKVHFGGRRDDAIRDTISRSNAIVVYPLGDKRFLCMNGVVFAQGYRRVLQNIGVQSNI